MNTKEVAQKLVEYCKAGENLKAIDELYAQNIISVEAMGDESMPAVMEGFETVKGKNIWWLDNHEVHGHSVKGPYFSNDDNQFSTYFSYDVTPKADNKRIQMEEVALYTVENGKITREQFMYEC